MRELADHKVPGLNEAIRILVMDEPGAGGAHHHYAMACGDGSTIIDHVNFQDGPVLESGPNGTSNEALIAIVIDRLRCFQAGEFACKENASALERLQDALWWLQSRTRDRLARGVEGTSQK